MNMTTSTPPDYLGTSATDWIAELSSSEPLRRRLAAHALGEIGPAAGDDAVAALTAALGDAESFVRVWAAAALAKVAPGNSHTLPALIAGLADPIYYVRSLAAWQLGRLGPEYPGIAASSQPLRKLQDDEDLSVRVETKLALQRIERKGAPPVEAGIGPPDLKPSQVLGQPSA
jgi:HEAT repeat protein